MQRLIKILATLFALILTVSMHASAVIPENAASEELTSMLRTDHPRLFFNSDSFEAVKERALGDDHVIYDAMKARVDKTAADELESSDYGIRASEAAFVYLVENDRRYMKLAENLLERSIRYYHECYAAEKPVNWYAYSRICAWAAYDWIFNDLAPETRKRLGISFLDAVEQVQPTDTRHYFFPQENWSGTSTGFYGNRSLLWYAGLATYGEDIDDRSEWYLAEGHRLNMALVAHRRTGAGDDGGSATASLNYALAAYPWSVNNFFHTWRSSTGENIALEWPDASYFTGYLYWNMLPGNREFGIGDSGHITNKLSLSQMRSHLLQIIHFFGSSNPENAAFARWMMGRIPEGNFGQIPFTPFLLTERHPDITPIGPAKIMPYARHFENMGQVFMRSGAGDEDSYLIFMCGGALEQHKHWDNNHFCLYHTGHLALDTGSRPPGIHTQNYYPRTVAHNCVLIHMPDETLPIYVDKGAGGGQRWGAPAPEEEDRPVPNDGGQYKLMGSDVVAFETEDCFSYVAGDATPAYSPDKCTLALRQIVFINPDCFVVFDRVTSTLPSYGKTWLLHTAEEPSINGAVFTAAHEEGRLFSRTLLPENAGLVKIGGPDKQFIVEGHNYAMPESFAYPDTTSLLGQWRVEVSAPDSGSETYFLHLLQTADRDTDTMTDSELVRRDGMVGVIFNTENGTGEVLFGTSGPASGHIKISSGDTILVDKALTRTVTKQSGLFGTGK
jgi:hypothetical protein